MHKKYEFDGSHAINRLLSFAFRFYLTRFLHVSLLCVFVDKMEKVEWYGKRHRELWLNAVLTDITISNEFFSFRNISMYNALCATNRIWTICDVRSAWNQIYAYVISGRGLTSIIIIIIIIWLAFYHYHLLWEWNPLKNEYPMNMNYHLPYQSKVYCFMCI